ncbi:MAG: hypothetical protein AAFV87_09905 [Pseudomonadota bacterium]
MRIFVPFILALGACAPQYEERIATSELDVPVRLALFESQPDPLDDAFRAACDSPGDTIRMMSRGIVQCRILPSPDLAAFLLLEFDGALEAPILVMQKRTTQADGRYLVEMSYFAEITQKSGAARRVYFQQRRLDSLVDRMLEAAGGVPTDRRELDA